MNTQRQGPARKIAELHAEVDRLKNELEARPVPIAYLGQTAAWTPEQHRAFMERVLRG